MTIQSATTTPKDKSNSKFFANIIAISLTIVILAGIIFGVVLPSTVKNNELKASMQSMEKCSQAFPDYLKFNDGDDEVLFEFTQGDKKAQPALDCLFESSEFTTSQHRKLNPEYPSTPQGQFSSASSTIDVQWLTVNENGNIKVKGSFRG